MNQKKINKITPRNINFVQWYTDIVLNAGLIEYGPVKGTIIFKPYGYAIWENIQKILDKKFKKINVKNVYFPSLIPKSLFNKEKKHIKGFAPEIITATKVGNKKLLEDLYIRPTSEVIFGNFFSKEIHGYHDLPLIYNQWVNAVRWEKTTRPFLRNNEFLWQEGHTIHITQEESKNFVLKILNIYSKFMEKILLLPIIIGKKTEKEKFAGTIDTYTIESIMHDGKSLQCATSHYFGQNFAKAFNIKFNNKFNKLEYAYSTSWGLSTRIIGAIIMIHGDDNGLILPPIISPIQIIIILVKNNQILLKKAYEINIILKNYRVSIDNTNKSFGFKSAEAEIKGIPLRIEIGEKDLKNNCVTIVRRDTFNKFKIKIVDILSTIKKFNNEINLNLYKKAKNKHMNHIINVNSFNEYKKILALHNKLFLVSFCGRISCENKIQNETQTVSRCIPLNIKPKIGKCFKCNIYSKILVYFGKSY